MRRCWRVPVLCRSRSGSRSNSRRHWPRRTRSCWRSRRSASALRLKRRVAFERKMLARTAPGRWRGSIAAAAPAVVLLALAVGRHRRADVGAGVVAGARSSRLLVAVAGGARRGVSVGEVPVLVVMLLIVGAAVFERGRAARGARNSRGAARRGIRATVGAGALAGDARLRRDCAWHCRCMFAASSLGAGRVGGGRAGGRRRVCRGAEVSRRRCVAAPSRRCSMNWPCTWI